MLGGIPQRRPVARPCERGPMRGELRRQDDLLVHHIRPSTVVIYATRALVANALAGTVGCSTRRSAAALALTSPEGPHPEVVDRHDRTSGVRRISVQRGLEAVLR